LRERGKGNVQENVMLNRMFVIYTKVFLMTGFVNLFYVMKQHYFMKYSQTKEINVLGVKVFLVRW